MPTMKIYHRWNASRVLYECKASSLKEAVEKAVAAGASLIGANLDHASLIGASLNSACLICANLDHASLIGANLDHASLIGANLNSACLIGANLDDASLIGANLNSACLIGANLNSACLIGASFDDASLVRASLDDVKTDLFSVLDATPKEVPGLLAILNAGKIDGSVYIGDCACLVGSIAKVRGCTYEEIPGLRPDASRPAERWFLAIRPSHTPDNHPIAKITAQWIQEWLDSHVGQQQEQKP